MKIACVSDLHGKEWGLQIPESDVLVVAGDIAGSGYTERRDIAGFPGWARRQPCRRIILVAGNHDTPLFDMENRWILSGVVQLHDSGCLVDGVKFWGFPWMVAPPRMRSCSSEELRETPYLTVGDYQERLRRIPLDVDVLVSHGQVEEGNFVPHRVFKLHVFGHGLAKRTDVSWEIPECGTPWIFASVTRQFKRDPSRLGLAAGPTIAEMDNDGRLISISRPRLQETVRIPLAAGQSPSADSFGREYTDDEVLEGGFVEDGDCGEDPEEKQTILKGDLVHCNLTGTAAWFAQEAARRAGIPAGLWAKLRLEEVAKREATEKIPHLPPLP